MNIVVDKSLEVRQDKGVIQATNVGYLLEDQITFKLDEGTYQTIITQYFGEAYAHVEGKEPALLYRDMLTHLIKNKSKTKITYTPIKYTINVNHSTLEHPFSTALSISTHKEPLGEGYSCLYDAEEACLRHLAERDKNEK